MTSRTARLKRGLATNWLPTVPAWASPSATTEVAGASSSMLPVRHAARPRVGSLLLAHNVDD